MARRGWQEHNSGKWARLRYRDVIAARQDKMLVFAQFREVIDPLVAFLSSILGGPA